MLSGAKDGEGNDPLCEHRQKLDGALRSPGSDRVDEERRSRDQDHEKRPRPADRSMRKRPLGGQELHRAQTDRRKGESNMKPYDCRGVEQWGQRHDRILVAEMRCLSSPRPIVSPTRRKAGIRRSSCRCAWSAPRSMTRLPRTSETIWRIRSALTRSSVAISSYAQPSRSRAKNPLSPRGLAQNVKSPSGCWSLFHASCLASLEKLDYSTMF
jgi:hypothetical protein